MSVVTQDDAREFLQVEKQDNPGKNIKGLVKARKGNNELLTMIQFYQELAQKYGGQVEQKHEANYCLFDGEITIKKKQRVENF